MQEDSKKCPVDHSKFAICEFDMLDENARSNPFPYYDWLQKTQDRVYKVPYEQNFYAIHKYEDVKQVLTNHHDFSSDLLSTAKSPFFALMDGEDHKRVRTVVMKMMTAKWPEEEIETYIKQKTTRILQKGKVELFDDWANLIPLNTLCLLLGLKTDENHLQQLHEKALDINKALFVVGGTGPRRSSEPTVSEKLKIAWSLAKNAKKFFRLKKSLGMGGMQELKTMFFPVRSAHELPRPNFEKIPDAVSALLDMMLLVAEVLDNPNVNAPAITIVKEDLEANELTKAEAVMACVFVIFAGYETTTSLLSNCVAHLAEDKKTFASLKSKSEKLDAFIEESLRFYTPVRRFVRRTNKEIKIGEQTIPEGAMIILLLGAANTDFEKFDDPFLFDDSRQQINHLSFGKGAHFCVGAMLARYQIKVSLTEILRQTTEINLVAKQSFKRVTNRDNGIYRYEELWVELS